jgi:hypothetical protein
MKIRNSAVFGSALGGFTVGTVMALACVCSGASLPLLREGWARVALYPGYLVGYHTFDLLGYSAAVSLACLTVGFAYSAVASAIATTLSKVVLLGATEGSAARK